jgi:hypothetical protein
MTVKVNISEVLAMGRRADRELGDVDAIMEDTVEAAAAELRATDPYQNRTGDLRASTQGEAISFGDEVEATLAMGMPYASFVIGRGFSNYEDVVEDTERELDDELDAIADRITG